MRPWRGNAACGAPFILIGCFLCKWDESFSPAHWSSFNTFWWAGKLDQTGWRPTAPFSRKWWLNQCQLRPVDVGPGPPDGKIIQDAPLYQVSIVLRHFFSSDITFSANNNQTFQNKKKPTWIEISIRVWNGRGRASSPSAVRNWRGRRSHVSHLFTFGSFDLNSVLRRFLTRVCVSVCVSMSLLTVRGRGAGPCVALSLPLSLSRHQSDCSRFLRQRQRQKDA